MQFMTDPRSHWLELAEIASRQADYHRERGEHGTAQVKENQMESYLRVVRSLDIERETGVSVCSCCFKPLGFCADGLVEGQAFDTGIHHLPKMDVGAVGGISKNGDQFDPGLEGMNPFRRQRMIQVGGA